jgi:ABC-type uncharacterized transport system permease subunit
MRCGTSAEAPGDVEGAPGCLLIGALAALAAIARLDLQPNLARLKVAILSGARAGTITPS